MFELFQYAIDIGKKVCLISDMYLPRKEMEQILWENSILGYYDLFISCDYKKTKAKGLFDIYQKQIEGESYLHIGDNYETDIMPAKKNKIDTVEIMSAREMLWISLYAEIFEYVHTISERNLVGLFVAKAFNNPFSLENSDGKLEVLGYERFTYLFIAPIISEFLLWLDDKVKMKEYDKILLFARDGYLIESLYKMLADSSKYKEEMKIIYFLTSRVASISSTIFSREDIVRATRAEFMGTPEEFLNTRFLIETDKIQLYQGEDLTEYILKHEKEILIKSKKLRVN